MNSEKRIFISYAREDEEAAKRMYTDIKQAGGIPWFDQEDLLPGQNWELEIGRTIRSCSYFIAIISEHSSNKRGYIQKELRKALDILEELPPNAIYIIPARLDSSEPLHNALNKIHRVDLFPSWEEGLKKILKSLGLSTNSKNTEEANHSLLTKPSDEEVIGKIRETAARDHPNDFSTQKFVIKKQVEALEKIKGYKPLGIPENVVGTIIDDARRYHPNDFSTQLFIIEKQVKDWKELHDT
ncbi:MAG: toll/interleukin-1 receptor domain-containing protein [Candidatus Contendobacter sp.]|nr:toll/interleukin-1 receptor domain-containing protein [Candidatus Contendobacter sp.]